MKIYFGKYFGKDIAEIKSSYLMWIVESYDNADITLINACKEELAERLKLDWQLPTKEESTQANRIANLENRVDFLEKLILMSIINKKWNHVTAQSYLSNHSLLESDLKLISQIQNTTTTQ